jgi:uncharacterized protein
MSLITLGVEDLKRSTAFYTETLGWPADTSNESVTFVKLNAIVLGLWSKQSLAEDAKVPGEGDGFPGFALAHNARSEEEVDEIFRDLKAKGVSIMKEPEKVFWGGYSGYFADPDGYLWEVAYNPFWEMDESGKVTLPS